MSGHIQKNRILQVTIHAIVWGLIIGLPLFFFEENFAGRRIIRYWDFFIIPFSLAVVFYINYFYLIDKFLFKKQTYKYLFWNLLLIIIVSMGIRYWKDLNFINFPPPPEMVKMRPRAWYRDFFFLTRDVFSLFLAAGLSVAIKMTSQWIESENTQKELEKRRAEAELKNLQNQLNPHFLFNTLNNIYSLIAFSPEKAQQAVHDLSKLLRYVLYENTGNYVPLEKELDFIRNYIELMRLRLSDKVKLDVSLPQASAGMNIAPLLFISLIENAFKHGVSNTCQSFVSICIEIVPQEKISCCIENSFFPKNEHDKSGSGIGLENLRRRLELLYPNSYLLHTEQTGDRYSTLLTLFLKPEYK